MVKNWRANSERIPSEIGAKKTRKASECRAFHGATEDRPRANRERQKPIIITLHTRTGHASVSFKKKVQNLKVVWVSVRVRVWVLVASDCVDVSVYGTLWVSVCLCVWVCVCVYVCLSLCQTLCMSVDVCLSVAVSFCVSLTRWLAMAVCTVFHKNHFDKNQLPEKRKIFKNHCEPMYWDSSLRRKENQKIRISRL